MIGIFVTLLGIIAIVICAIQVYKTAVDAGRTPALWTLRTIGVGLFFQFILPFVIGLGIGVYLLISGTPLEKSAINAFGLMFIFEIVCLILGVVGMFFVMNRAAIIPDEERGTSPTPPFQF